MGDTGSEATAVMALRSGPGVPAASSRSPPMSMPSGAGRPGRLVEIATDVHRAG